MSEDYKTTLEQDTVSEMNMHETGSQVHDIENAVQNEKSVAEPTGLDPSDEQMSEQGISSEEWFLPEEEQEIPDAQDVMLEENPTVGKEGCSSEKESQTELSEETIHEDAEKQNDSENGDLHGDTVQQDTESIRSGSVQESTEQTAELTEESEKTENLTEEENIKDILSFNNEGETEEKTVPVAEATSQETKTPIAEEAIDETDATIEEAVTERNVPTAEKAVEAADDSNSEEATVETDTPSVAETTDEGKESFPPEDDKEAADQKRNRFFHPKHLKAVFLYFSIFFVAIVFWEILLRFAMRGTLAGTKYWFLIFAVPQALLPAAFCGWRHDRVNRAVGALFMMIYSVFFVFQLIYFRISGSVFSLSMMGMGGAVMNNFGWTVLIILRESVGWIILFLLPDLLMIVWIFIPKPKALFYHVLFKPIVLLLVIATWIAGGQLLRLGGTSDSSAYYAFRSAYADTDTSANKIGIFTTSIVEFKGMLFGTNAETEMADAIANTIGLDASGLEFDQEIQPAQIDDEMSEDTHEEEVEIDYSPNILNSIDFDYLASITKDSSTRDLCVYFGSQRGTNKNRYTGLLADYNVIMICGEAFSSMAISEELTPTLYRMSNEGIVLTHYYNSFKNTTTNGEFAFMTGLWPDVSRKADSGALVGSFGQNARNYMPYGMGNVFTSMGVKSYGYHNYYGSYYGREKTHKNLGYSMKFMGDGMRFSTTWPSSDLEMFEQSVDDYINEERFNVYYMTFSGHGPYTASGNVISRLHYDEVPAVVDGRELTDEARCYLANSLELEYSMAYLLQRLEEAGKLENTLIVLTGDHYPYYMSDVSASSLLGGTPDPDFEYYRSSCIMWCGGLEEPVVVDTPCCNVDILPTVLNLLGVDYDSRLLPGTDIFSDSLHVAMIYNKNFITDRVKYNAATGQATWLIDTEGIDEKTLQEYTDSIYSILKARYASALSVNDKNFYRFVWDNLIEEESPGDSSDASDGE